MTEILPIGSVLTTDAQGFIMNECSLEKISPPWNLVVEEIKSAYLRHLGSTLHSIYLRGSVPRGQAIPGISDVDTFAVVLGDREALDLSWKREFQEFITSKYSFCQGVELTLIPLTDIFQTPRHRPNPIQLLIKTQSLCIFGESSREILPGIKPGIDATIQAWTIRRDITKVMEDLQALENDGTCDERFVQKVCSWIMKRILRTGFELVMEREGVYTRDLYPCWEIFSRYYPREKDHMKRALQWAILPETNPGKIRQFLESFGGWLIAQVEEELLPT